MVGLARGTTFFFLADDCSSVFRYFYEFIDYMVPISERYRVIRQKKKPYDKLNKEWNAMKPNTRVVCTDQTT